jgi:hypothetical protein
MGIVIPCLQNVSIIQLLQIRTDALIHFIELVGVVVVL